MEDMAFTIADLASDRLFVEDTRLGDFTVEDSGGNLVIPAQRAVLGGVEVDLTGYEVSGTWHIRFHRARFTAEDSLRYGLLFG